MSNVPVPASRQLSFTDPSLSPAHSDDLLVQWTYYQGPPQSDDTDPATDFEETPLLTAGDKAQSFGLPEIVRQQLAQAKRFDIARLLEILYRHDYIDCVLPRQEIVALGRTIRLSRKLIDRALNEPLVTSRGKQHVFAQVVDPVQGNLGPDCQYIEQNEENGTPQLNTRQKARGRPKHCYHVPTLDQLCIWLDVYMMGDDSLLADDSLYTNSAYRQAIYGQYIDLWPGQYSRRQLGHVAAVTPRTTARYDRAVGVKVTAMFKRCELSLAILPQLQWEEDAHPGAFLEDGHGQLYRPRRETAEHLLKAGERVHYVVRERNYYEMP